MQSGNAAQGHVPGHLEEIKRRLSIVDIVQAKLSLKKSGRNYRGLCPFHNEKSGSFFVFPETNSFYCFGCHEAGDIFGFVMKTEGVSFGEAVTQLAARAGVQLPERNPKDDAESAEERTRKTERERLKEIHAAAATYFQHLLLNSKEGQAARDYLAKRGVNRASIEMFGLGYSLDNWTALSDYLTDKSRFSLDEVIKSGLIIEKTDDSGASTGKHFDRFRGRLMYPIRDRQGAVIAFGGRVLEGAPKDSPKYLNSPQTAIFDKSGILYGFDLAKETIRRSDRAVIVEGYMDVIVAHQYGYNNVVAPLGTALNPRHVGLIKRLTKRVVLALDADTAGEMASLRGLEVMKQGFDTKTVPIPTARGLIRFEQELDADVRVAVLPTGKDPDEVVREGGGKWPELIERALPTVDYYFAAVAASVDLNSARGKSEAVERLAVAIVEVRDRIQREHYIQKLARLTHLDVAVVRVEVAKAVRNEQQARKTVQNQPPEELPAPDFDPGADDDQDAPVPTLKPAPSRPNFTAEDFLLSLLIRYPDGFEIEGTNGEPVKEADFNQTENNQIFRLMFEKWAKRSNLDIEEALPLELQSHFKNLEAHIMGQPELPDLYSIREAAQYQLDRVRETRLRQLYEQGSQELEESGSELDLIESENLDQLWQMVSELGAKLRIYYPKPSPLFQDTRSR